MAGSGATECAAWTLDCYYFSKRRSQLTEWGYLPRSHTTEQNRAALRSEVYLTAAPEVGEHFLFLNSGKRETSGRVASQRVANAGAFRQ